LPLKVSREVFAAGYLAILRAARNFTCPQARDSKRFSGHENILSGKILSGYGADTRLGIRFQTFQASRFMDN
jgi:hypothetical protein